MIVLDLLRQKIFYLTSFFGIYYCYIVICIVKKNMKSKLKLCSAIVSSIVLIIMFVSVLYRLLSISEINQEYSERIENAEREFAISEKVEIEKRIEYAKLIYINTGERIDVLGNNNIIESYIPVNEDVNNRNKKIEIDNDFLKKINRSNVISIIIGVEAIIFLFVGLGIILFYKRIMVNICFCFGKR